MLGYMTLLPKNRAARANKNFKMEVLPAELHPQVDAIDIEEGFYLMLSLTSYSPSTVVFFLFIDLSCLQMAH